MDDSDSGIGSNCSSLYTSSINSNCSNANYNNGRASSSMSGDDRSGAGSRSSASIPIIDLRSSSSPLSVQAQHSRPNSSSSAASFSNNTNSNNQSRRDSPALNINENVKIWRDPQANESQIRHVHSDQHHPLYVPQILTAAALEAAAVAASTLNTTPVPPPAHNSVSNPGLYNNLLPPPLFGVDHWTKQTAAATLSNHRDYLDEKHYSRLYSPHHGLPLNIAASMHKQSMERLEIEYREMERHKEMDRERERHHQQQHHQQSHITPAQAQVELEVTKHFEESLKRAKKNVRTAWPLNTLPPQHLHHAHLSLTASHVQSQLPTSVSLSAIGRVPSPATTLLQQQSNSSPQPPQSGSSATTNSHHNPQSSQSSHNTSTTGNNNNNNSSNSNNSILNAAAEAERRRLEWSREREKEREREKDLERLRQQQAYYAVQSGLQRGAPPTSKPHEYDMHRNNAHPSSISSSKSIEKSQPPQLKSDLPAGFPMYSYHSPFGVTHYPTPKDLPASSKIKNELGLPTPPPLMSDNKLQQSGHTGSVIVKHDTHKQSPIQMVHHSPKVPSSHYKPSTNSQNSGGVGSTPSHSHPQIYDYNRSTANDRYKPNTMSLQSNSQAQYINAQQTIVQQQSVLHAPTKSLHYQPQVSQPPQISSQSKPKVSSPAPSHIYGQPSAPGGIGTGIPVCRPSDTSIHPVIAKSSSPSPFQLYAPPPPGNVLMPTGVAPPPAHSSRYDSRMFQGPSVKQNLHGTSPPTGATAPPPAIPMSRSPGIMLKMNPPPSNPVHHQITTSYQTQPLDLGVPDRNRSDESCSPPKRKSSTLVHSGSPIPLDVKKKRTEPPTNIQLSPQPLALNVPRTPPPQQRFTPPVAVSPLATASTTIPVVTSSSPQLKSDEGRNSVPAPPTPTNLTTTSSPVPQNVIPPKANIPQNNVNNFLSATTSNASTTNPLRTISADGQVQRPPSNNSNLSPSVSPGAQSAPATPAKFLSSEPEKCTSPAPEKKNGATTSGAPRNLKKAWLQRHTVEDFEDTTGVVGSGSCVKLPLTLSPSPSSSNASNDNSNASQTQRVPQTTVATTSSTSTSSTTTTTTTTQIATPKNFQSTTSPVQSQSNNFTSSTTSSTNNTTNSITKSRKNPNKQHSKKATLNRGNGHNSDSDQKEESSSSDQERVPKHPPKRKKSKVKRRKGAQRKTIEEKKKKIVSESEKESDSDKESLSDKDSDSGTSGTSASKPTSTASGGGSSLSQPRKRGRRPKTAKDEPSKKKLNRDSQEETKSKDPFRKPPISQLKKTGESFLQDGPCFEVAPKLSKCRECRWTANQRSKSTSNIFCRFYAFRRLRYNKNGQLAIAGFSDPFKDPSSDDLKLWMPDPENPPKDLDLQMSRLLLTLVGDQFCDLLQQEKDAMAEHMSQDKTVAWKRVVQGVREMCDVCETTLFNYHWACGKCGFVVCIDCYKDRKRKSTKIWGEIGKDRDDFSWLLCTNRAAHQQESLILTQIIAGNSLKTLGRRVHETRALWQVAQECGCPLSKESPPKATNGICKDIIRSLITSAEDQNGAVVNGAEIKEEKTEDSKSALSWLAEVALQTEGGSSKKNGATGGADGSDSDTSDECQPSTLRDLLIRKSNDGGSSNNSDRSTSPSPTSTKSKGKKQNLNEIDFIFRSINKDSPSSSTNNTIIKKEEVQSEESNNSMVATTSSGLMQRRRGFLPIRIMTHSESKLLYPDVPHSWLCDGRLLRLLNPTHLGNVTIFQDQWKRGQPVLVSDVSKVLNMDLWKPESFSRDFGEQKNDLINCMTGNLVPQQPMKKFWDGFEYVNKRLKDEKGKPMLLKLKDWPPGEDFSEILPTRFTDLMKSLPLGNYTQRSGRLNLASRLPEGFVRPDLGPKMYNAYGSALHPTKGTTNLHLDISDAVNVMVYVGIPKDGQHEEHIKEAFRAIDEAGCDILTRRRVREKHELPGALWHIYAARDADKIRDLLNKIAIERGAFIEAHHDPIHDQYWYLDGTLRERLYKEYGVEGYPIAQCLGDAVFIPAGAPHQVRNLHNCVKVAEDFVSPENVSHCFRLTQEFRNLSDSHSNHEDKLQIKNIIYHAIKDSISFLSHLLGQKLTEIQEEENDDSNPIIESLLPCLDYLSINVNNTQKSI